MPSLADLLATARSAAGLQVPAPPRLGGEDGPSTLDSLLSPYSAVLGGRGGLDPLVRLPVNPLNPWASMLGDKGRGTPGSSPGFPGLPGPSTPPGPSTDPGPTTTVRGDYSELARRYGPLVDPKQGPSDLRLQRDALSSLNQAGLPMDAILGGSYRSNEQQTRLYATDPNRFASPGSSLHEYGLAIDVAAPFRDSPQFLNQIKPRLLALGWYQERSDEPWHFSYGVFGPPPRPPRHQPSTPPRGPAPDALPRRRRGATSNQLR